MRKSIDDSYCFGQSLSSKTSAEIREAIYFIRDKVNVGLMFLDFLLGRA
jgi:hypothetical protein